MIFRKETITTALAVIAASALFSLALHAGDTSATRHQAKSYALAVTSGPGLVLYHRNATPQRASHGDRVLVCNGILDMGIAMIGTTCMTRSEQIAVFSPNL